MNEHDEERLNETLRRALDGELDAAEREALDAAAAADPALAKSLGRQRRLEALLRADADADADTDAAGAGEDGGGFDVAAVLEALDRRARNSARPEPKLARPEPELARPRPELARPEPELARPRPELARPRPELAEWWRGSRLAAAALVLAVGLAGAFLWPRGGAQRGDGSHLAQAPAPPSTAEGSGTTAPAVVAPSTAETSTGNPAAASQADGDTLADRLVALSAETEALDGLASLASDLGLHPIALRRRVEALLDEDASLPARRGALRYLGVHGDRASVRAVDGLRADPELAPAAAETLAAIGTHGWNALTHWLVDEAPPGVDTRSIALGVWPATEHPASARLLAEALPRLGDRAPTAVARLLEGGAVGAAALVDALESGGVTASLLARVAGREHAVAVGLLAEERRLSAALCELAGRTRAETLVPALVEGLADSELSLPAAVALARIASPDALLGLVGAEVDGRLSRGLLTGALSVDPIASEAWAATAALAEQAPPRLADALASFLLEEPRLARDPALARLAGSPHLAADLRLLCVEQSGADSAAELTRLVRASGPGDARLAAAALARLDALGDPEQLCRRLAADGRASTLLAVLADQRERPTTSGLVRLARELRPLLPVDDLDPVELP